MILYKNLISIILQRKVFFMEMYLNLYFISFLYKGSRILLRLLIYMYDLWQEKFWNSFIGRKKFGLIGQVFCFAPRTIVYFCIFVIMYRDLKWEKVNSRFFLRSLYIMYKCRILNLYQRKLLHLFFVYLMIYLVQKTIYI